MHHFKRIFGVNPDSTWASNQRRLYIRLCLWWTCGYGLWLCFVRDTTVSSYSVALSVAAIMMLLCSLLVFTQIVLLMPFRDREGFRVDAKRLLLDTIVSSLFMIVAFSLLYRNIGLSHGGQDIAPSAVDALYFSAVTFSTLGYGDFAPTADLRIAAAFQALLGNLHLGMIVGSTFAAIRPLGSDES